MDIILLLVLLIFSGLIFICGAAYLEVTFDPPLKAKIIVTFFGTCFLLGIGFFLVALNIGPKINEDTLQYYKSSYVINPDGTKRQICVTDNEVVDIKEVLGYVMPDDSIVCRYYYHKLRWVIDWGDDHNSQYKIIDVLNTEYKEINEKYFLSKKEK